MISSELLTRFSELLLTFVLNAVWQVALIAALASCGAWLLRHASTRYQHGLWVAALCLSLLVPAATAIRAWPGSFVTANDESYSRELSLSLKHGARVRSARTVCGYRAVSHCKVGPGVSLDTKDPAFGSSVRWG